MLFDRNGMVVCGKYENQYKLRIKENSGDDEVRKVIAREGGDGESG